jgi:mRNA-degrading endonuclease RelE of RelBE toxin-antitoxin system
MSYSIKWSDRSEKFLNKLPSSISKRIVDKIESMLDDPHRTAERCEGYPWYHQRVGNYRAILDIDDTGLIMEVLKIGPRKKVYNR